MTTQSVVGETPSWQQSKSVLSAGSLSGLLHLLSPGAETSVAIAATERVLYVAQGSVTAVVGDANFILNADEMLLVPADRPLSLRNPEGGPAKVLVLTLRPTPRSAPPVVTFPSGGAV